MAKRLVKDAVFTLATVNYDAQVRGADLSVSAAELNTTNMDSAGWEEFLAGLKSYTLDVDFVADADTSGLDAALWTLFTGNAAAAWTLKGQDAAIAATNVEYRGSIIVLKPTMLVGGKVGDVLGVQLSFKGTGAITRHTSA